MSDDAATRAVLTTIDLLEPFAPSIRTAYAKYVDTSPCCGWLAMWCELERRARLPENRYGGIRAHVHATLISIAFMRHGYDKSVEVSNRLFTRGLSA